MDRRVEVGEASEGIVGSIGQDLSGDVRRAAGMIVDLESEGIVAPVPLDGRGEFRSELPSAPCPNAEIGLDGVVAPESLLEQVELPVEFAVVVKVALIIAAAVEDVDQQGT